MRRYRRGRHHRPTWLARLRARLARRPFTGVVFVPTTIISGYLLIMSGVAHWAFNL